MGNLCFIYLLHLCLVHMPNGQIPKNKRITLAYKSQRSPITPLRSVVIHLDLTTICQNHFDSKDKVALLILILHLL